jgi:glucokinase
MTSFSNTDKLILAVDIGGTKTAVAAITTEGRIISSLVDPTVQKDPASGINQIIQLLDSLITQLNIPTDRFIGIGIGIPAVLERETDFVVWGPNLMGWKNVDLKSPLESHFHLPVCIEYDGHTALLGEWWMGAAKGYKSIVSVIIGTGLGGGMVLDGHLIRGMNRLAGASGWFALTTDEQNRDERARSLGFWESKVAGPGFAKNVNLLLAGHPESSLFACVEDKSLTALKVFQAAENGDVFAKEMVDSLANLIGIGVANIISLINPEIVILGGGVGSHCGFILPRIQKVVGQWAQPISAAQTIITTSKLGADAGLLGAAFGVLLRKTISLNNDHFTNLEEVTH